MTALLSVPALARPARPKKLASTERVLASGLRVMVVRRPSVPMVEIRLRMPFLSARSRHLAKAALLSDSILTGTANLDRAGIAMALQELGGDISIGLDADRLLLSGSGLSSRLPDLLGLLADVVTSASYNSSEVSGERERLVERITIMRSQSGVIANEALAARMAPGHPYGTSLPQIDDVVASTAAQLRKLHAELVRPHDAVLVIVGDLSASKALDQAERALSGWTGTASAGSVPALPEVEALPLLVVNRPGSVQTSLRFGGDALPRSDERYPALQLTNLSFGGYFSSRWVENIREDKGFTYSPRSSIDHAQLGSSVSLSADVATEVTAPALLETMYELGRMATLPITDTELESVRQYAIGTLALSTSTQAGLASTLSTLLGSGMDVEWLASHPARLAEVTAEQVADVSAEFLAPQRLVGVAVGDAEAIVDPLSRLTAVDVA